MPEDFTSALRNMSGTSDDDDQDLYGPGPGNGDDEGADSGDEQWARRVLLNPAPDANVQELRKVSTIHIHLSIWDCHVLP